MFRYSVLLCLLVKLYGTPASPYKSWGEEKHTAFQDTRSHDFNEKVILGLKEVEPVEEQDLKEVDIDPRMAIWKAMKRFQHQKHNKPEEVKDKLHLPSEVQNLAGNKQVEAYHEPHYYSQDQLYQEAEKDLDKIYHSLEGLVNHADLKDRVVWPERPLIDPDEDVELHEKSLYMTPEEDQDYLFHS